ncbi:MAG TPA: hypothetical protein VH682_29800 [Gemmataceae bacterium]
MNENPQTEKHETPAGENVDRLLERAKKGDATVLPQLRRLIDASPTFWHGYGDLALQARASWVQLTAGPNLILLEGLMRKAAELTKEVAGASPSPLEQLLAERVAVCWLQVSYYDSVVAQTQEFTPAKARILQKQHDAAQRHYLAAIKTLATVRKLLTPSRSPVEIASKLAGERSGLRLREAPVEAGVPVAN